MAYDKLITTSSSVSHIQYSPEQKILRVTYNNGATWDYADVPDEVWQALDSAESVGTYIANNVKNNYQGHKVGEEQ